VVAGLRAAQFLRISGSARRVELYHDRIREAIDAGIPTTKRRHLHRLIAGTLIARGADDPEPLFEHFRAADEVTEASRYAVLAAKKADAALAFDRAAGYYKAALELTPEAADHREWAQRRAAALAHAGRPAVAADAYLKAADEVDATRSVELQRLSAEQLLIGGHVDRGLEVIRAVLRALGMRLTRTPRTALASFLWRRALLRWRGLTFVERSADRIRTAELLRMDTCWSVACGLALVDTTRAADFHTRHLLLALDGGEPYRIARAFALDTAIVGAAGGRYRQQALDCAARAETMAQRVGHPHVIGLCALARGSAMFAVGDWPAAEHCCDQALRVLRDHSAGTIWELNAAQLLRLGALLYQGRLRNVSREVPMLVAAAHERGNLYLETELRTRMNLMWLVADAPEEGERQANEAIGCWSEAGFHRQHYNHVVARVQTELYRRHALAAWRTIAGNWSSLERELLLRIQFQRIEARYLRARCALLMAATGHNARHFRSRARRDASSIARENMPWSDPLSSLLTAGVAYLEGNLSAACGKLTEAAAGFDRAHMNLYAAVARRRLGELAADEDSQERRRQADAWMTSEGIVNASRITRLIAPGFPDIDR
jgi:tetratricopeptide (TPR) repeat protein